jgi:hypothetical protein
MLFILCVLAVGIVLCLGYFWIIPAVRYSINASKPARTVSAEQLRKEIRENLKEAQSNYPPGTLLIVTGVVIGEDRGLTLTSEEKPNEPPWIACLVPETRIRSLGSARIDDVITVQGFCSAVSEDFLVLRDCTLLEHNEKKKS